MALYREDGKVKDLTGPEACFALVRKAARGTLHTAVEKPVIAPAPGWHYMATGELMKDPE